MDIFSLLIFRLESYILRIKVLYSYIFKFFLPAIPGDEEENSGIFDKGANNIRL